MFRMCLLIDIAEPKVRRINCVIFSAKILKVNYNYLKFEMSGYDMYITNIIQNSIHNCQNMRVFSVSNLKKCCTICFICGTFYEVVPVVSK